MSWLESQLVAEIDQLPLWTPVAIGCGIATWFAFANDSWSAAFILICAGLMMLAVSLGLATRLVQSTCWYIGGAAIGCLLIWCRSTMVAAPVLERPQLVEFTAEIITTESLLARDILRLTLRPIPGQPFPDQPLPPRVRVNLPMIHAKGEWQAGAMIRLKARLMPPAPAALPGAYDFSRRAWFAQLGASGQVIGAPVLLRPAASTFTLSHYRRSLSTHVQSQMAGAAGAIGATLATGDRGAISLADAEAMRRSGLAHLLSISGLHVAAVVGAIYLLVIKSLALSPFLANRLKLPVVAAAIAAIAAIAYTLLTGAQVPTIRACVAAILILVALMLGRNALSLRMVAAGALFVLILWPEALVGPSFQLSFAAVTAIIALHEHAAIKAILAVREENMFRRMGRFFFGLFLTGMVVEIVLMPIALYHFHKAGIYGALANIVAIPLTTFVIMPLEALALLLDILGLGAPIWWLCSGALNLLVALAHLVSDSPGAVVMRPMISVSAFGLVIFGGLWLALWRLNWRYFGLVPAMIGMVQIYRTESADLYITGDGRHVAIVSRDSELAMLRVSRSGFIHDLILENAGIAGEPQPLDEWPGSDCNSDTCLVTIVSEGRQWRILATRSGHHIPRLPLSAACQRADIVISDRYLPASCEPRWLKADRKLLRQTGGMAINLADQKIITVAQRSGGHKWSPYQKSR